jgi:hypothetical protein
MKYLPMIVLTVLISRAYAEEVFGKDATFSQLDKHVQALIREDVKMTEFTFRIQDEKESVTLRFPLNDGYHKHPWHRLVLGDQETSIQTTASGFKLLTVDLSNKGLRLDQKKVEENVFRSEVTEMRNVKKLCFLVIVRSDDKMKKHFSLLKFIEIQSDGRWLLRTHSP